MLAVLSTIAPIFLLMAAGYTAVKSRLLDQGMIPGLGRFVLYFTLPALIFSTVSQMKFSEIIDPSFVAVYALGSIASLTLGTLVAFFVLGNGLSASALKGLGMSISNTLFMGYPVMLQVLDDPPTNAFAMVVMVENIITLPLALLLIEYGNSHQSGKLITIWRSVLARIARSPLVIAIAAGLAVSALGIQLPATLTTSLGMLAQGSAATALFVIGASLMGNRVQGDIREISLVVIGKLLIHPALILLMLWLMPPLAKPMELTVLLIAAMPMFSIYPIIGSSYGLGRQCSSILVVATLLSFFTISGLLLVVT